ncbi:MAG: type 1 glutamine amidotransferase domain-containing protein [Planctomycetota bacterium]
MFALLLALFAAPATQPAQATTDDAPDVVIVLTNHAELGDTGQPTGFFLSEAAHPWQVFIEAGYDVIIASPEGGLAPIDPKSLDTDDAANAAFLKDQEVQGESVMTVALTDVDLADTDAIFYAGGHGTMFDLPDHPAVLAVTAAVYEQGGVVAAVCHGPAALVNVKVGGGYLVAGKRVTAFTNAEEDAVELTDAMPFLLETILEERGATFVPADNFEANAVRDGRLVTGQNPASAEAAAKLVVEALSE